MNVANVIKALLHETGWSQARLGERLGVGQNNISRYLSGQEPRGKRMEAIRSLAIEYGVLDEEAGRYIVPVMGYVGAGGDIEPEHEQVPFDGLEQLELAAPLGVLGDLVGFMVRGESMQPRYNDGDVVLVDREPRNGFFDALIGDEAVVATHEGRRYLKRIMPSEQRGIYKLVSVNAPAIYASIRWASAVRVMIPGKGMRRIHARTNQPRVQGRRRNIEGGGT